METTVPFPERLRSRGFLQGHLQQAMVERERRSLVWEQVAPYAHLDASLPLEPVGKEGGPPAMSLSPGTSALLLLALDPQPENRVLVVGPDPYPAVVAKRLVGEAGEVTLAAEGAVAAARARVNAAGLQDEVDVVQRAPWQQGAYDRVLATEESLTLPTGLRASLRDMGAALVRTPRAGQIEPLRILRSGDEFVEFALGDLVPVPDPTGAGGPEPWPLRRYLALESALRRGWTRRPGTPEELEFQRAVDETWRRTPVDGSSPEAWTLARGFFHAGYVRLLAGDVDNAEDAFRASLGEAESAEAHTFLGWTWSFTGRLEEAIGECKKAIRVDPAFGNAYNDIGAYLLEMGRVREAEAWLERAIGAPRYAARAYPYANLARARLMRGDREGARDALRRALDEDPAYQPARQILRLLEEGEL